MPRKLLINADDLGFDADTFTITTRLIREGTIKSATIILGYPESATALAFARDYQREISFGLHFNIAEGSPIATEPVPSLVGANGQYHGPTSQRLRALTGLLRADDIAAEATAQLAMLADHGLTPSHLDSHGHLHKFPAVLAALRPVMSRFGIHRVRLPQTSYDNQRFYNRALDSHCLKAFQRSGLSTTHAFFNTRSHETGWFDQFLSAMGPGMTELGVHPGSIELWRAAEAAPLAQGLADKLSRAGVELISYHEVD